MSRGGQRATNAAKRDEALQLAEQHGAAEASRMTGVPASTIRMWGTRARQASPLASAAPPGVDETEWLRGVALKARDAVDAAVHRLTEILPTARGARDVSIAAGVMVDQLSKFNTVIRELEDRQVKVMGDQADLMVAVLEMYHSALGVDQTQASKRVLATLLRQAGNGEILSRPEPDSTEVFAAVREQIGGELREKLEVELRKKFMPELTPELPAAGGTEVREVEELAEPRTVEPDPEQEITDAEVVAAEPVPSIWLNACHGNERVARLQWEAAKAADARREKREREKAAEPGFFAASPSSRADFSILGPGSNMRSPGGGV